MRATTSILSACGTPEIQIFCPDRRQPALPSRASEGPDLERVGAGLGLGQRHAEAQRPRDEPGQQRALLRIVPKRAIEMPPKIGLHHEELANGGAAAGGGEVLDDQGHLQHAQAGAAELLRAAPRRTGRRRRSPARMLAGKGLVAIERRASSRARTSRRPPGGFREQRCSASREKSMLSPSRGGEGRRGAREVSERVDGALTFHGTSPCASRGTASSPRARPAESRARPTIACSKGSAAGSGMSAPMQQRALEQPQDQRRFRGDLVGERERLVHQLVLGHDAIGEADRHGLLRGDGSPVNMISLARHSGTWRISRCVPPAPGKMAERDLGQADRRAFGEEAEVEREQQLGPAAERPAVDRGDRGLVASFDAPVYAMDRSRRTRR